VNLSSNGIVQQLTTESALHLQEIGKVVGLGADQWLEPLDGASRPVYFLLDAVVSLWVARGSDSPGLAVALVGSEGMAGCSHLWSGSAGPWVARVFKPGLALQIEADDLRGLLASMPGLAEALCRFLWRQTLEIAQLSTRMQQADIRAQLALWLHLLQYKTGQQTLKLTQQMLANMMGTRRVSVTLAAGQLQHEGILTLRRGEIQIDDLQGLAQAAGLQA
jgi:CRP-like cAMP-binding protein